jgi:transposase
MESEIQEIRREKVFVPVNMNIKDIMKKYGVAETTVRNSKKKGWLVKNYSTNQIIIDREVNPKDTAL